MTIKESLIVVPGMPMLPNNPKTVWQAGISLGSLRDNLGSTARQHRCAQRDNDGGDFQAGNEEGI